MKTAIIYASTYGSTRRVAQILNQKILNSTLVDIKKQSIDPTNFDTIILGSSIYIGQIDKQMKNFIHGYKEVLKNKKLGIYFCCGFEENLQTYLDTNFDEEMVNNATVMTMGGEMDVNKMSFAHKMITRMVQKSEQGKNREVVLHLEKADEFVRQMFSQTE
ncbi:MAG: flavodoxin [Firmicutes bacterium HGW-Firmicutes-19]|jgi:menaquinone-dependent protoporphyrinogen oxidase|nr:MAG: flavodoxin [Firmicutes bacterium HGW-Firmicutes-19]